LQKRSLVEQERHLALEVPISKMAHAERGERTHLQNNNKAKHEQLKLNKTGSSIWP
jgi:hypothetical protein